MASVARPLVRPLYLAYLGFILAVLYFPFVVMTILSFQGPRGGHTFPLRGVSTIWYWKLFNPGKLTPYSDVGEFLGDYLAALQRSVVLAVITMLISLWFRRMDLPLHWLTTGLPVHVMWTLPFSLIIFLMFFNRFDTSLEDAALILGATRWKTFRHVTLPLMQPAILTSLLFAFTLSLDEFQRSLLITGTDQTLPLMVMASVTTRITPTLYALGTLTTLLSFAVVGAYLVLLTYSLRKSRRFVEGSGSGVK